jgi:NAD(P)-dependent dehydrogenase (short-subunit alcohol dehydrogenase family)
MKGKRDIIVLTGAGQIGMAIARRMAYGNRVFVADWKMENAETIAKTMIEAGFDVVPIKVDISDRTSVLHLIDTVQKDGEISMFINAAGVSPSQASIEQILKVDLYGTALLLDEFGKIIKEGGTAVTISSQSGHRMPALTPEEDKLLATTPTEDLLNLNILKPENISDTLHAYQMAKRCNVKRVMAEAVKWSNRRARVNSISPGIIITPLALDEINGPRGNFYKNMFAKSPAGRPGIADEVAKCSRIIAIRKRIIYNWSRFLNRWWCNGIIFLWRALT